MGRRPPPPPPSSHFRQPLPTAPDYGNGSSTLKWLALGALACTCLLMMLIVIAAALYLWLRDQDAAAKSPEKATAAEAADERSAKRGEDRENAPGPAGSGKGGAESKGKPADSPADASESTGGNASVAAEAQPAPPPADTSEAPASPTPNGKASGENQQSNGDELGSPTPDRDKAAAGQPGDSSSLHGDGASRNRSSSPEAGNAGQSAEAGATHNDRKGGPRTMGEGQPVAEPEIVKPATGELFGLRAKGKRFVYLIDCSSNMSTERLERIRDELVSTLQQLDDNQRFFTFLYSDDAFPMYHPEIAAAPAYAAPNEAELAKVRAWLSDYYAWGDADPAPAVARALKMRPDAVFLLTASEFDDAAVDRITELNERETPIHAIAIFNKEAATAVKAIAKRNGGHAKFVRE